MARKEFFFEFGEMLMICRKRSGMTKSEVAKKLNVSVATISNYEAARTMMSYKKILRFKKVFGSDFDNVLKIIEDDGRFGGRVLRKGLL